MRSVRVRGRRLSCDGGCRRAHFVAADVPRAVRRADRLRGGRGTRRARAITRRPFTAAGHRSSDRGASKRSAYVVHLRAAGGYHVRMGSLLGDLRYAWRSLVRQPTFAAMAILTLVLGIGTNTAIFSVIKVELLNQLPCDDPSRLVVLWEQNPTGNTDLVAPLTFVDWRDQ